MAFRKRDPNRKPKKGVYLLPNTLTLCGMFSGFFAILSAIKWGLFDCRLGHRYRQYLRRPRRMDRPPYEHINEVGIELDSLSDLVALGSRQHYDVQVGALSFRKSRLGSSLSFRSMRGLASCPLQCADRHQDQRLSKECLYRLQQQLWHR